jgi:hypothetical protein
MSTIYSWTFDSGVDGWTRAFPVIGWQAADGSPSSGCLYGSGPLVVIPLASPGPLFYLVKANSGVRIRLKSLSAVPVNVKVYLAGAISIEILSVNLHSGLGWESYDIDISAHAPFTMQYLHVNPSTADEIRVDTAIVYEEEKSFTTSVNYSPVAMSVSPDDYYVYVGVLDGSSNPVLLQLLADLSADSIKAYDPGAGSAIGVHCADLNEEWVWIAGEFGGAVKVRVSIDDGATWSTRDPGTWNGVALPIVLGPDDDNLVLVPTDGDDDLFETDDGGLNWATLNAALPFDVNGMDRLDLNLDEIMIGSDADRGIRYSPNNGVTLHDLSDVAMANVRVSDLIIG